MRIQKLGKATKDDFRLGRVIVTQPAGDRDFYALIARVEGRIHLIDLMDGISINDFADMEELIKFCADNGINAGIAVDSLLQPGIVKPLK
jgi:hypothetical protein